MRRAISLYQLFAAVSLQEAVRDKLIASEKGFYSMSYLLSLFGAVAVRKNVRDVALVRPARD